MRFHMRSLLNTALALLLVAISPASLATDKTPPPAAQSPPASVATSASHSAATALSESTSQAGALSRSEATGGNASAAGGAGGDGGASNSDASANSGGNSLSTSSVYKEKRQAPGGVAFAANATVGCFAPRGAYLSAPGAGVGFTGGKVNKDCALLIAADDELRRGNLQASIQLRCATKVYRETLGTDCPALLNTQTVERTNYATKDYVDRAFRASQTK
jgi:hypothetical protein